LDRRPSGYGDLLLPVSFCTPVIIESQNVCSLALYLKASVKGK
jgi:hypothetical protein